MKNDIIKCAAALFIAAISFSSLITGCSGSGTKAEAEYKGVQIGAITYSWRSSPGLRSRSGRGPQAVSEDLIELMGNVVEEYAGAPAESVL